MAALLICSSILVPVPHRVDYRGFVISLYISLGCSKPLVYPYTYYNYLVNFHQIILLDFGTALIDSLGIKSEHLNIVI